MPRDGKFSWPHEPDNSMRFLLKSYIKMRQIKKQLIIVPVAINWERKIDIKQLLNQGQDKITVLTLMRRINKMPY